MSTKYNTVTPVQSHRTDTNTTQNQIQYKPSNARKPTCLKHNFQNFTRLSKEIHEASEREGAWPFGGRRPYGGVPPPREVKGVARLEEKGEGEWKMVVMLFVVSGNGGVGF